MLWYNSGLPATGHTETDIDTRGRNKRGDYLVKYCEAHRHNTVERNYIGGTRHRESAGEIHPDVKTIGYTGLSKLLSWVSGTGGLWKNSHCMLYGGTLHYKNLLSRLFGEKVFWHQLPILLGKRIQKHLSSSTFRLAKLNSVHWNEWF